MSQPTDAEVIVKILTVLKNEGVEAAKKSVEELKGKVDSASDAGKTLARFEDLLNDKTQAGTGFLKGLAGAMKNGASAANLMKGGIAGLGNAMKLATPEINLLLMAVQVGISVWQAFRQREEDAAKAAENLATSAREAAEAAGELEKISVDRTNRQFAELAAGIDEATKRTQELATAKASLDDARTGLEMAKIDVEMAKTTDPEERARLAAKKTELASLREQAKIQAEIDALGQEIAAAEAKYNASLDEVEKAKEHQKAVNAKAAKAEAEADQIRYVSNPKDAVALAAAGNLEQHAAAARQAAAAAVATATENADAARAEMARTTVLKETQRAAATTRLETAKATGEAASINSQRDIDSAFQAKRAAKTEEERTAAEKARTERAERDKNMSGTERISRMQGLVENAQRTGGETYRGGEPGAQTKARAEEAIAAAAREIEAGGDDLAIIQKLVSTLEQMGAVVSNYRTLISQLDKMDGRIDQVASQIKNARS